MLYPLAVDLLARELVPEVRESLRGSVLSMRAVILLILYCSLFYRIGAVKGLIEGMDDSESAKGEEV